MSTAATYTPRQEPSNYRWGLAVLASLVWHVVLAVAVAELDPLGADGDARPEPIEVVFAPTAVPVESRVRDEQPHFTELPAERADQPPEVADALSNVDSRARDAVDTDDANTELPRLEGESDVPAVSMQPAPANQDQGAEDPADDDAQVDPVDTPQPESTEPLTATGREDRIGRRAAVGETVRPGETGEGEDRPTLGEGLGNPRRALDRGAVEVSPEPRFLIGPGRDDVFQEEMNHRVGDAMLFGDVSLNTIAWDWAPWLQRFTREFYANWVPPYAYFLGLIEGEQLVEIEVAPDGRLMRLDVLDETGHESLREATVGNFRGFAPYQPLPDDFPEPTLRLTVRVIYPGRK